jgi:hypothetical protein
MADFSEHNWLCGKQVADKDEKKKIEEPTDFGTDYIWALF